MSFINPKTPGPEALIANYILEKQGRGLQLPYRDYEYIHHWLELAQGQVELVLASLQELLGEKPLKSLAYLHPPLCRRLKELRHLGYKVSPQGSQELPGEREGR